MVSGGGVREIRHEEKWRGLESRKRQEPEKWNRAARDEPIEYSLLKMADFPVAHPC